MFVAATPLWAKWYAELLEPAGLRWEAERWFEHYLNEPVPGRQAYPRRRNIALPADGWLRVLREAEKVIHGPEGRWAGGAKPLHRRAFHALSISVGNRYRLPKLLTMSMAKSQHNDTWTPHFLHCWWRDGNIEAFGGGLSIVYSLQDHSIPGIGACWRYQQVQQYVLDSMTWPKFHPANPAEQERWIKQP